MSFASTLYVYNLLSQMVESLEYQRDYQPDSRLLTLEVVLPQLKAILAEIKPVI